MGGRSPLQMQRRFPLPLASARLRSGWHMPEAPDNIAGLTAAVRSGALCYCGGPFPFGTANARCLEHDAPVAALTGDRSDTIASRARAWRARHEDGRRALCRGQSSPSTSFHTQSAHGSPAIAKPNDTTATTPASITTSHTSKRIAIDPAPA